MPKKFSADIFFIDEVLKSISESKEWIDHLIKDEEKKQKKKKKKKKKRRAILNYSENNDI